MNQFIKYILVLAGLVSAGGFFIYGSVLPLLKAQAYIDAVQAMGSIKSEKEFEANFDNVFNQYSPVGGEEVAKFLESNILSIVGDPKNTQEPVIQALLAYIEPKIYPDTRHYLAMGGMYTEAVTKFKKQAYYDKAVGYYEEALKSGPKLPPPLYALFSLYQASGDAKNEKAIGSTIVSLWPQDTRISDELAKLGK